MSKSQPAQPACEPWYDSAFQRDYLRIYAHRDQTAAQAEVNFILAQTPPQARARILDIACGAARHLLFFSRHAQLAVGLDRSEHLLSQAAQHLAQADSSALLLQADMRYLPFSSEFTCATLLFTSFGYFPTDDENLSVIRQAVRALKPAGVFWMDYINEPQLRRTLQPYTRHTVGPEVIEQHRCITEDNRVEKQILIVSPTSRREFTESVKLYSPAQIRDMFQTVGLRVCNTWGDFQGNPHNSDSPRLILMGQKND